MSRSQHSGARQWRHECDCLPEVAEARHSNPWIRMHSLVSERNLEYFITEDRLDEDLTEAELRERFDRADGTLIVCNVCGALKEVAA